MDRLDKRGGGRRVEAKQERRGTKVSSKLLASFQITLENN